MTEVAEQTKAEKRAVVLNPQRIGLAEQLRQDFVVNVEEGTTLQDLMEPQYWSHCSAQFQQFDHIECRWESGERIANLVVVSTGRNWAQVHLAGVHDLEQRAESLPAAVKHTIEWKGPQRKHVVIRIADQQSVKEGFSQKAEAQIWLANHERVTGA